MMHIVLIKGGVTMTNKIMKISYKKMKELHQMMGGNAQGFFITEYGMDTETGQSITIDKYIAEFDRPHASANRYLVKGSYHKFK
jgi:hypothetical protein